MTYYAIDYATNKIGRSGFPQAQNTELDPGKKVTDPDFVWNLKGDQLPSFEPYIGTLILRDGSAITDFISSAVISIGFVCNEKVISIIKKHQYGNTQFYKLKINHKTLIYEDYRLMHTVNNYASKIDFNESEFQKIRFEKN